GHGRPISGPAESNCSHTFAITRGGRKWVWTSNRPGSPSRSTSSPAATVSVTHPLEPAPDRLLLLPLRGPLGERVPLVPGLLASRQPDLDLGPPVLEVERERDDGQPLLVHLVGD